MGKLLVIAAGGTGGHMFPAQALAETMLARGWRVKLSTDDRGARYAGGFPGEVAIEQVKSATFARGGVVAKLAVPFRLLAGVLAARREMRADPPAVVAGFGGYPTIPALSAAWLLGIPRLIHEQNGVLGRVNGLFATRVQRVTCGTSQMALPAGATGLYTGNPVRRAILEQAGAPYPGLAGRLHVLVIGGSQGARALSDHVPAALAALPEALRARLEVSHQARPEDAERVTAFYRDNGISAVVKPFFDDVPERMAGSALVISRAGASTVADLTGIGRPSILIPLPTATGDHQTANARALVAAGAAVMLRETEIDATALAEHIASILTDPERAAGMAAAALGLGRPEAAETLGDLVQDLSLGDRSRE